MPVPIPPKTKKEFSWGRFSKTLSFWILILLIPVVLIQLSGTKENSAKTITYTQYRDALERDNIQAVKITAGKTVTGTFKARENITGQDVKNFSVRLPVENSEIEVEKLNAKGVAIEAKRLSQVLLLPWILRLTRVDIHLLVHASEQPGRFRPLERGRRRVREDRCQQVLGSNQRPLVDERLRVLESHEAIVVGRRAEDRLCNPTDFSEPSLPA